MKTRIMIATLGMIAAALAQTPRGPAGAGQEQPRLEAIKTYLTLTDAQVQALGAEKKKEMEAIRPIREQLREKERSLRDALQAGDTAGASAVLAQIKELRAQIDQIRAGAQTAERALLTPDQTTKLATLE